VNFTKRGLGLNGKAKQPDKKEDFDTYANRPRTLGLIARRMVENMDDGEYLENAAVEMAYRSKKKGRFVPGTRGDSFDHEAHLAGIMKSRGMPEEKIDEVLDSDKVQEMIEAPETTSPPPVRTL
jgi:hypothetical protein